jgi:TatD DNase family protein
MLVDSHAHLAHPDLENDLDSIISRALKNGVGKIVTVGCTIREAGDSIKISEKYENVYATAGLYPRDSIGDPENGYNLSEKLQAIRELSLHPKVVAIGECGLDFSEVPHYEIDRGEKDQFDRFEKQILLAEEVKKPLIIHSRNAKEETLSVIKTHGRPVKAVWHCFSETPDIAERALNFGLNISFTGNITYPKNTELREIVKFVPIERIMIETDSPYLTPHKARESKVKINEPQYVKMVAEEIASIKGISFDEVARITSSNASEFYIFA